MPGPAVPSLPCAAAPTLDQVDRDALEGDDAEAVVLGRAALAGAVDAHGPARKEDAILAAGADVLEAHLEHRAHLRRVGCAGRGWRQSTVGAGAGLGRTSGRPTWRLTEGLSCLPSVPASLPPSPAPPNRPATTHPAHLGAFVAWQRRDVDGLCLASPPAGVGEPGVEGDLAEGDVADVGGIPGQAGSRQGEGLESVVQRKEINPPALLRGVANGCLSTSKWLHSATSHVHC